MKNFKLLIVIFSFSLFIFSLVSAGRAQSPPPEASPGSEVNLNEKIKGVREAVKEKVREKLEEVKKGQKRAFVGEINEITNSTLILTTRRGEKQAKINKETTLIDQNRREIKPEDLEVGSYVITMGYLEDTDLLDAKRVVVTEEPKPLDREAVFGIVSDISSEEKIITIKGLRQNAVYTLEVTSKTQITQKIEEEIKKIKFTDINEDDRLIVVGELAENEEKIIIAKIIYLLSSEESLPTEKVTSSPTPAEE